MRSCQGIKASSSQIIRFHQKTVILVFPSLPRVEPVYCRNITDGKGEMIVELGNQDGGWLEVFNYGSILGRVIQGLNYVNRTS
jgi:hypothetical protein